MRRSSYWEHINKEEFKMNQRILTSVLTGLLLSSSPVLSADTEKPQDFGVNGGMGDQVEVSAEVKVEKTLAEQIADAEAAIAAKQKDVNAMRGKTGVGALRNELAELQTKLETLKAKEEADAKLAKEEADAKLAKEEADAKAAKEEADAKSSSSETAPQPQSEDELYVGKERKSKTGRIEKWNGSRWI